MHVLPMPFFTLGKLVKGPALQLRCENGTVFFIAPGEGISSFTFTVRDGEGSAMTRTVNIVTSNDPALYDDNETDARITTKTDSCQIIPSTVKVWPVPAKGRFNVLLDGIQQPVAVEIYGIDGTMIGRTETVFPRRQSHSALPNPVFI